MTGLLSLQAAASAYKFIRPLFFALDAEDSHNLVLKSTQMLTSMRLLAEEFEPMVGTATTVHGLHFANRLGLAAGFDKNGDFIDILGSLGFGHIEVGTVTPRAQPGNPRPRLFRLVNEQGLINRMGFNNKGVDYLVKNLQQRKYKGVIGVNIGKNADTPLESAADDYLACYRRVYALSDYIAVNISSPNTAGLRDLQSRENLRSVLEPLLSARELLATEHRKRVPLFAKFAPDLTAEQIAEICELVLELNVDGVIATNTTVTRHTVPNSPFKDERGGLSGKPLSEISRDVVRLFREHLGKDKLLIGVGGILSAEDAMCLLNLGANLVQIYTGLVFRGPGIVQEIIGREATSA